MANITQTIPALTAGISQQPDEQKIPGQVKNMVNALPDVTQGLTKRPAGKFVASLSDGSNNSTADGRWFHYYRDENEQYIGQISRTGIIKMWDCLTGAEKSVVVGNTTRSRSATYTRSGNTVTVTLSNHDFNVGRAVELDFTSGGATDGLYSITQVVDINTFRIEDTASGSISTSNVTVKDNYLMHTNDEDLQTLTLNDFTYLNNRSIITEMDTTTEPLGNFGKEIFVELKKISYSKQYSLNIFDQDGTQSSHFTTVTTATRINVSQVSSSNSYCDSNNKMQAHADRGANQNRCGESAGDGRDSFAPNVGTRIFSIDSNKELVDEAATGGTLANGNRSDVNYTYNVSIHKKAFGGTYSRSGSTVTVTTATPHGLSAGTQMYFDILTGNGTDEFKSIATVPSSTTFTYTSSYSGTTSGNVNSSEINQTGRKNLYFRIATTGQSVPFGSGSNVTYQARYTVTHDLLHGGEGWLQGDFFYVWMKDAYYKVTIDTISTSKAQANLALVRPQPTPFDTETTITAESILGDIRASIVADGNIADSDITTIGTGLHIKRTSVFNASTPVGELLNVIASKVNDVGDLPSQCKDGMVVEVINSVADEDNHFVKFFGNNGRDGEGTWEECAKPGRLIEFKKSKMPLLLIRTADGNFRLSELDGSNYTISGTQYSVPQWDDAIVGDDVTNPEPSFIGKGISKMLFFRNRFAILADENIVLSRPGDFTNFFAKSAIQLIASDPIDIAASSEYPAILFDGIQVNTGLLLFSKNQQFMLTTDSDVFSPTTAKINALATYNFNFATNPISLGTTVGFLDNAGKFSRFFEMAQVQREGEPEVIEQSAVVARLFEKDLKLISNSRENSVIFFSEEGTSTLYGYRYFDSIRERKLAAWFKWTLTGTIQYHCMQDDNLYVVVRNGASNKDQLLKYSIKMDSNTFAIAENRVHLDHLMSVTTGSNTYSATTNKTTFAKPTGIESTNQLAAYDVDSGDQLGRYGLITNNNDGTLSIDGNWSSQTFLIGHQFTMQIDLPTFYYVTREGENFRADTRSSLVLHRAKLGFGPVGLYETTLNRTGRVSYTELFELTGADQYVANTSSVVDDNIIREVPIYDSNKNVSITIKSTHPAPATIHNLTWEGAYNTKFYQRV